MASFSALSRSGFAAFIEVNGKRILFDTGDNPDIFGHCTGEPTFVALKQAFGGRYLYAGLGMDQKPSDRMNHQPDLTLNPMPFR